MSNDNTEHLFDTIQREDAKRFGEASERMAEVIDMIGHPEIKETLMEAVASYCAAYIIGAIHAIQMDMVNDLDGEAFIAILTED